MGTSSSQLTTYTCVHSQKTKC